jgi:catechol 2,3-dioxygenase-like lactoylglutathione lyase family enzyme
LDWKLEVVVVPVSDVDRSKAFYSEQLGFVVDVDHRANESMRVVQLTPPGSACSVTIGTGLANMEPGSLKGLQLVVPDIAAARAQLVERGVDATPVRHIDQSNGEWIDGHGGPWNSFVFFDDPDGNSWAVQEKPAS